MYSNLNIISKQKPLRRIEIEEIGEDPDEERRKVVEKIKATQSQTSQNIAQHDEQMFEHFVKMEKSVATSGACNHGEEVTLNVESVNIGDQDVRSDSVKQQQTPNNNIASASICPHPTSHPRVPPLPNDYTSSARVPPLPNDSTSSSWVPPLPETSFQFQADWKSLRNHEEQFYQYFKVSL